MAVVLGFGWVHCVAVFLTNGGLYYVVVVMSVFGAV